MISLDETFSSDVSLRLHVGQERYELGQLGPNFAILREPHSIAADTIEATVVELETLIDGRSERWPVKITSPITNESKRFTFEGV